MDITNTDFTADIFISSARQQAQLDNLSNSALSRGIELYMNKDYKGAIQEFQRSIGLSRTSPYSVNASNYTAMSYLKLNDTEKAIQAYKTSIDLDPERDDTHIRLGNLYFSLERYHEAETRYEEAIRINPTAAHHYSLGQVYLNTERYSAAESQFSIVDRLEPEKPNGQFGKGLTYSKQGRYEDAIGSFEKSIKIQKDFYSAFAEIGYAYADLGEMDKAQELVEFLEKNDANLADTLSRYMYRVDPPKLAFAYASSTFSFGSPPETLVSDLDPYLENANASRTFTMKFQFDKAMDRESVEDPFNWLISKSTGQGPGQAYNFGLTKPPTDITIKPYPVSVYYDAGTLTATVYFDIQQNGSADGTLDPSHVEFKFKGVDRYGLSVNPEFDQYTGFSGVA